MVQAIVITVTVAVLIGLSLEGFSMIFKKSSVISRFKLQRESKEETDLNQPLTKRDLAILKSEIFEEMEHIKAAIHLQTPREALKGHSH